MAENEIASEEKPKKTWKEEKVRPSSRNFYFALSRRLKRVAEQDPNLDIPDFNVFCRQRIAREMKESNQVAPTSGHLSTQEVAEYFGVKYKTVYRLIKRGDILAVQIGSNFRVPGASVFLHFDAAKLVQSMEAQEKPAEEIDLRLKAGAVQVLKRNDPQNYDTPRLWEEFVQQQTGELSPQHTWEKVVTIPN